MQFVNGNRGASASSNSGDARRVRSRVLRRACGPVIGEIQRLESRQLLTAVIDWQMREGTGTIINDDAALEGNQTGELLFGAAWSASRPGTDGFAVSLDGASSTIAAPDLMPYLGAFGTLAFWINTTQTGNDNPRLAPAVAGTGEFGDPADIFWGFLDSTGRIGFNVPGTTPGGGKNTVKSNFPVNDGTWHHVAMTRDGTGEIKIYVDGILHDSGLADAAVKSAGVIRDVGFVQQGDINADTYLAAHLDQFLVDNSVLTATQVGQLFNPTGQLPTAPTNLAVAYQGARALRLTWTPSANTSFYEVYRRIGGGTFELLPTRAGGNSFFDTGLTPETTYEYRLRAVNPSGTSADSNTVTGTTTAPAAPGNGIGLQGIYYDNDNDAVFYNATGRMEVRIDPQINFRWLGGQPHPKIGGDTFEVNWSGELLAQYSEPYTFFKQSDDGFNFELTKPDGTTIVVFNDTDYQGMEGDPGLMSAAVELQAGVRYKVRASVFEGGGDAGAILRWQSPSQPQEIIPQSQLFPPESATSAPAAPASLTADAATAANQIDLNWADMSGDEVGFIVYRSSTGTPNTFTEVGRTTTPNFTDTVFPGATYHYHVRAFSRGGPNGDQDLLSAPSNSDSAQATQFTGTGVTVKVYSGQFNTLGGEPTTPLIDIAALPDINITWAGGSPTPRSPADNFTAVFEGTIIIPTAGVYTFVTRTDDGSFLWIDGTNILNDPTYHWYGNPEDRRVSAPIDLTAGPHQLRLRMFEGGGDAAAFLHWIEPGQTTEVIIPPSAYGAVGLTVPGAPGSAAPTNIFSRRATINWLDADGETVYQLERASQANFSDAAMVAELGSNVTSFTDTGLTPNTTYYYRVRSAGIGGHSAYTNLPAVQTLADEPVANTPTNLTAERGNNFRVTLRWTDASLNETGFRIMRKEGAGGTYAEIGSVGENVATFSDDEAKTEGGTYFYQVLAINGENEASAPSNEVSVVATVNTLPAPWQHQQIGGGQLGDAVYDEAAQSYHITGGGSDIWNNSDEFHYMYQEVTGDFVITTRVKEQIRTHEWSKAGPEIREKLIGPSRHVGLYATGDHDPEFSWRHSEGGATDNRRPYNSTNLDSPMWLRIARVGDTFFAWTSLDGANYTPVDTDGATPGVQGLPIPNTVDYPDTMYVGLAVSGVGGTFGDATFDQVDLQLISAPVPASNVTAIAMPDNRAFVQWTASPGELGAQVERRDGPAGAWTPVGAELYGGTGEFVDAGLTPGTQYSYRVVSRNSKGTAAPSSIATITATAGTAVPAPWQTQDVGQVGIPGSASFVDNPGEANDVFQLNGGGVDIWSNNDEFRFVYQQLTGDFTITTRMLSQERTSEWSKSGLDARESLENLARHVYLTSTGDHDPEFGIRRDVVAGNDQTSNVRPRNGWNMDAPMWLRIQRVGDTFYAFTSGDGANWLPVDTDGAAPGHQGYDLDLPDTIYVGLATSSVNDADVSTAEFDNVSIEQLVVDGMLLDGTAGNDNWYLKRVGDQVHLWNNADGSGAATSQHPLGEALTLNGLDGDDVVTIDMSGGDITLGSLTINTGAGSDTVRLTNGDGRTLTLGGLPTLNGESLDLGTGDLKVTGATAAAVEALVATARNATTRWQGPGIGTTAATAPNTGLAVATVGSDVIVKFSYDGDANVDGLINADDYFRIDSGFLDQPVNPTYAQGDFNFDDTINADDYFLIDSAFLGQGTPLAAAPAASSAAAPVTADAEGKKKSARRHASDDSLFSATRIRKRGAGRSR